MAYSGNPDKPFVLKKQGYQGNPDKWGDGSKDKRPRNRRLVVKTKDGGSLIYRKVF
jgi:hypothetical protein